MTKMSFICSLAAKVFHFVASFDEIGVLHHDFYFFTMIGPFINEDITIFCR